MTNEELIARIRGGAAEYMEELFDQNRGMIATYARRYCNIEADPALAFEDFMQEGYIALAAAAEYYNPAKGAFTTVLTLFLRRHMRALAGLLTSRRRAHRGAVRLDAPISEEGDDTLLDLVEDPAAAEAFDAAEFISLQAIMREALSLLPVDQAAVIRARYGIGRPSAMAPRIARELGADTDTVRRLQRAGLLELRKNKRLMEQAKDYLGICYRHVGVEAFRSTWTSSVELAAITHEYMRDMEAFRQQLLEHQGGELRLPASMKERMAGLNTEKPGKP